MTRTANSNSSRRGGLNLAIVAAMFAGAISRSVGAVAKSLSPAAAGAALGGREPNMRDGATPDIWGQSNACRRMRRWKKMRGIRT